MQLNSEQRVFIVEQFYLKTSPTKIKRGYFTKYRQEVSLNTIKKWIRQWRDIGTILNQNKGYSGRRRTGRSEENIAMIEERINKSSQS
jgi:transposase